MSSVTDSENTLKNPIQLTDAANKIVALQASMKGLKKELDAEIAKLSEFEIKIADFPKTDKQELKVKLPDGRTIQLKRTMLPNWVTEKLAEKYSMSNLPKYVKIGIDKEKFLKDNSNEDFDQLVEDFGKKSLNKPSVTILDA